MSKELAKKANTEVTVAQDLEAWGDTGVSSSDLVIPKALLMQGLSDFVADGKAAIGEYVNSLTGEVIAKKGEELELIPFHMTKYWAVTEANGNKFRRVEEATPSNENNPWDFTDSDGTPCKRTLVRAFYCLDVKEKDGLPLIISFASTAAKIGKKLATRMFIMNRQAGKVPCAYSIKVSSSIVKGDKGTYASPDFVVGSEVSNEDVMTCRDWMLSVKAGTAKADTSDQKPVEKQEQPANYAKDGSGDF